MFSGIRVPSIRYTILSKIKIVDFSLIVPLNYGHVDYQNFIVNEGHNIFEDKFVPLLNFLKRDEYYALFDEIDVFVMNHIRTQAGANIVVALRKGKPVFINPKSSIYQFFTRLGIKLYPINLLKSLTMDQINDIIKNESNNINNNIKILNSNFHDIDLRLGSLENLLK